MNLSELRNNEIGVIVKVRGRGAFRKRIIEMGFVKGKEVKVIKNAPLKDPIEYEIMGYQISLRRNEASLIEIITAEEAKENNLSDFQGIITNDLLKKSAKEKRKYINIALVGNPNAGKTTIFNQASGSHEHVGNYSGVTVGAKLARFKQNDYQFNLVDLPGTYSLTAYSPEEIYVRRYIADELPDIVINVVDASNLERNLYLTTQLIDMDIKVIVALNMYDEMEKKGAKFDYESLGKMIGVPFIPTVGAKSLGIKELFDKAIEVYEDQEDSVRHIHINYGEASEESIKTIQQRIKPNKNITDRISSRFLAIKLLEKDKEAEEILSDCSNLHDIKRVAYHEIKHLEKNYSEDSETILTDAKYGFIAGALKETYKESPQKRRRKTDEIDNFVTHKVFGFPIFILFIWIMFQTTFSLGHYPMVLLEKLVALIGSTAEQLIPAGMFKDLLINGVIDGVGGVIVFLPNILILFFFISLMEDTGYMARAAFIMDKLMHKIGLHGKSFIPLIMGFGCTVPAILATRTLENKKDRLLTMLINPFMSCSARLPVYILITGAFFSENAGTIIAIIYFIGILLAIGAALVLKKFFIKGEEMPFVMELPPYRIPTMKSILRHMWQKGAEYLKKMGGVILVASIIIWALGYFPKNEELKEKYSKQKEQVKIEYQTKIKDAKGNKKLTEQLTINQLNKIENIKNSYKTAHHKQSYIGHLGQFIEPVIRPLGFDWKMGVSLFSGIAGKEIVVSTIGVLYQATPEIKHSKMIDEMRLNQNTLADKLKNETYSYGNKKGEKVFNPLVAFCFMLFILVYFPCVAVIAAIKKEANSWKWAIFTIFYTTTLAWLLSFIVYQVGSFFYF